MRQCLKTEEIVGGSIVVVALFGCRDRDGGTRLKLGRGHHLNHRFWSHLVLQGQCHLSGLDQGSRNRNPDRLSWYCPYDGLDSSRCSSGLHQSLYPSGELSLGYGVILSHENLLEPGGGDSPLL